MLNGIRKNNVDQWVAFRNGKPVGWHKGPGSKAHAIRQAGTNALITDEQVAQLTVRAAAGLEADLAQAAA